MAEVGFWSRPFFNRPQLMYNVSEKPKTLPSPLLPWMVLAASLAALLVYGIVKLVERPRIETITTSSPSVNSNTREPRGAEYIPVKHSR